MKHLITKKNRALLAELVRTDFKLRYQGSVLGYAWSLLRPLLIFCILYLVFVVALDFGSGIEHYPIYLLVGVVIWTFFSDATLQCLTSIVGRGELIRKISIPKSSIIFSTSISALINLCLNTIVVFAFAFINDVPFRPLVFLIPVLLLELYVFTLGISFFLAAAYVKYRDIGYIWEVILQAGFYLTPVLYPLTKITNITAQKIILMNPVAQVMQDTRYVAVTNETVTVHSVFDGGWYSYIPFVIVAATLVIGVVYFKRESKYFAENI